MIFVTFLRSGADLPQLACVPSFSFQRNHSARGGMKVAITICLSHLTNGP